MTRISNRGAIPPHLRGAIIALGNFDGFHKGHQAVAGAAIKRARALQCPAIIATFDPHPVRLFRPDSPPFRLTSLDQREIIFTAAGADAMLVFEFDRELATTSAEDFVEKLLVEKFGARGVVTGEDFTFGAGRKGNVERLKQLGAPHGLETIAIAPVAQDDEVVSSSNIREYLRAGQPEAAARLMTRPFTIEGLVEHGDKNGRALGFPTANLDMGPFLRPRYGIYAITAQLEDGRILRGAANLGIRPQFTPPKELLEPHLFDFSDDLYGQKLAVSLHHFLRDERKFDSLDALKAQIRSDCEQAKEWLETRLPDQIQAIGQPGSQI